MKTIKDEHMYHSQMIMAPSDKANARKVNKIAKRTLDGQQYVTYQYKEHIEMYSNSQLRGMLANEIGNQDTHRVMCISNLLKKRLALPEKWRMPKFK